MDIYEQHQRYGTLPSTRIMGLAWLIILCVCACGSTTPPPDLVGKIVFARGHQNLIAGIYVMDADGSNEELLTELTNNNSQPVWSPDGTRIAFVSDRDGNEEIYVMNADGSNQTRLTHHPDPDRHPSWSPDGTQITFFSFREPGGIYVVDADGLQLMHLINGGYPAWSPDGTRVAFAFAHSLFVIESDGSNRTHLADLPGELRDMGLTWSPDGNYLAFVVWHDRNGDIYRIDADGSNILRLTHAKGKYEDNISPTWSPDGKYLMFVSSRERPAELYVMEADGSHQVRVRKGSFLFPDWTQQ